MTIGKVGRTGQNEQQAQANRRQRWEALLTRRPGRPVDLVGEMMAVADEERAEIVEENRRLRSQRAEAMREGLVAQHLRRLVDEAYRAWDGPGRTPEQYLSDLRRWASLRKRMLDAIRVVAIAEKVAEENEEFLSSIADMSEHHAGVWQERALKAEAEVERLRALLPAPDAQQPTPPTPRTKEEQIAFRKDWDARYEAGIARAREKG